MDYTDISLRRQQFSKLAVMTVERLVRLVANHWLALANLATFLFIFMSGLAPFLMSVGLSGPGQVLYLVYKAVCHDVPSRHYVIFGYRMTLDHRSLAIYASVLGMGMLFALVRHRLRPLNWRLFVLMALPMTVDGFTQLFGFRESNWELRTITGALFGIGSAWFCFPYVESGMRDVRESLKATSSPIVQVRYEETA